MWPSPTRRRAPSVAFAARAGRQPRPRPAVTFVVRKPSAPALTGQPERWVVGRAFGWPGRRRRLAKGYERTCASSEAFVTVARIGLTARRLRTQSG